MKFNTYNVLYGKGVTMIEFSLVIYWAAIASVWVGIITFYQNRVGRVERNTCYLMLAICVGMIIACIYQVFEDLPLQ